ncbi:MAG: acetyl-CoA carboxylase biotin carboxylase subunit [Candidatus Wallbacteria bacterium]|nr:acetyl-CoA carboxylase biotin carboxylase subunit [Candidatus Wallbacteria bacterium]
MFSKVLIANRGEIAVRIIRACRDMGLHSVAVHSTVDRNALHVKLADESVCVGGPAARASYLNIPNIISAAEITGAQAIHPGYGFLAENADFAEICQECDLTFVGPSARVIALMGDKAQAKVTARQAEVPLIEGSEGLLEDVDSARTLAERIGYPVLLKAAGGGGGKGMRIVRQQGELESAFQMAQSEAKAAFNNGGLYMEQYLENARHIEMQILFDGEGNGLLFPERECSVQRRHQKLIEESPSPGVTPEGRKKLLEYAGRIQRAVEYRNAGTIEFLLDRKGGFHFIEMNTRLQVEHGVSEMITGIDIVREQLAIAGGSRIAVEQRGLRVSGHAIEFRINAEDPENGFAPSPGVVHRVHLPAGPWVRVDTLVEPGTEVLPHYDSLIAKLIVWGENRAEAIRRARRALKELSIEGPKTTRSFHLEVLHNSRFLAGDYSTHFIQEEFGL